MNSEIPLKHNHIHTWHLLSCTWAADRPTYQHCFDFCWLSTWQDVETLSILLKIICYYRHIIKSGQVFIFQLISAINTTRLCPQLSVFSDVIECLPVVSPSVITPTRRRSWILFIHLFLGLVLSCCVFPFWCTLFVSACPHSSVLHAIWIAFVWSCCPLVLLCSLPLYFVLVIYPQNSS